MDGICKGGAVCCLLSFHFPGRRNIQKPRVPLFNCSISQFSAAPVAVLLWGERRGHLLSRQGYSGSLSLTSLPSDPSAKTSICCGDAVWDSICKRGKRWADGVGGTSFLGFQWFSMGMELSQGTELDQNSAPKEPLGYRIWPHLTCSSL